MLFLNLLPELEREVKIFRKTTTDANRVDEFAEVERTRGIVQQPNLIEAEFVGGAQGRVFFVYVPIASDVREGDILEIEGKRYGVVERKFFQDLNDKFSHFKLKVYLKNDL